MVMCATMGFTAGIFPGFASNGESGRLDDVATEEKVDKAPREQNREGDGGEDSTKVNAATKPAEVSNYEIVNHWFSVGAERLGLEDDIGTVMRTSYREVQVQLPIRL